MSVNQRGCLYLIGVLVFAAIFCVFIPFILLPSWGTGVALPVITVPAEYYRENWPTPGFELVNTLGGALLANIIVLLIAFGARAASKNWTRQVPGRLQGFVEVIGDLWWGLTKQQAGNRPKTRNVLFPLVASLFLFLLAANWGKLLPGVESIGVLHCANYEEGFNGFPIQNVPSITGQPYFVLRNDGVLNTGTPATDKGYHQCEAGLGEQEYIEEGYLITRLDPYFDRAIVHETAEGDSLSEILAIYNEDAETRMASPLPESVNRDTLQDDLERHNFVQIHLEDPYAQYTSWRPVEFTGEDIISANTAEDGTFLLDFEGEDDHEGESADHAEEQSEGGEEANEASEAEAVDDADDGESLLVGGFDLNAPLAAGQTVVVRPELFNEEATTRVNQLYTVAPFVRGVSTDLSFTLGLSIMAFFAIQFFGVWELGIDYFQKFINVRAIGNIASRPLGAIDFVVGLFEIISEVGKVISLSFRLFGALFAGSVLYAVFLFLFGTTIPVIILLLEVIVGGAQAGVFAVLTLLFCAQAMVSHHHDEEHGHDGHDGHDGHEAALH